MVSRRVEGAQKKVEERNFEVRKNLLEYDEVMDEQRKRVYGYRQNILDGANCKQLILKMIDGQIDHYLDQFLDKDYGAETFAGWASKLLSVELEARDFRGMDFAAAELQARDNAERMAEGQVLEALEENLPEEEDPSEWNWEALAKLVNTRWRLSLRDRDLKQLGRDHVGDVLIERARAAVGKIDLGEGERFLDPEFGLQTACNWVRHKFGLELAPDDVKDLEPPALKQLVRKKALAAYEEKEMEYPVMAGLLHFTTRDAGGHKRYDREELVHWAADRFHVELSLDDLKNKQRDAVRALLAERSRRFAQRQEAAMTEALARLERVIDSDVPIDRALRAAHEDGRLAELSAWLAEKYDYGLLPEEMLRCNAQRIERHVAAAVEERYRPEMRRMERALVLQLLDTAWKDHLLSMDHLRSSVGLRGYAQIDPKVEFKREGMRIFEQMWTSVGERTTDLIFRMEQLDEGFVGSTWKESEAIHEDAQSAGEIASQQQAAIEGTEADHKPQPIRNRQQRVRRNDPCPCGSGKKFKACCMRKG
ncbi:MAG: SEC-C domain-containing protein [Planctomycetales bacterium]|nr:SEC-C domain-containing protein [Planctomycetales bacterium]